MSTRFHVWRLNDDWTPRADSIAEVPSSPAGPIALHRLTGGFRVQSGSAVVLPAGQFPVIVSWGKFTATIGRGSFAQLPPGGVVSGFGALIIHTPEYAGLPQVGGPVETSGRLKYIDGCSDSLIISPALLGDPCLNHLHLPAGTEQTAHTHPSERIGIILHGRGVCRTNGQDLPLEPGMFWRIPTGLEHSFHTREDSLDVLAWHPDSDFGPSHDHHPMVNRTIVDGAPANDPRHAAIRTT